MRLALILVAAAGCGAVESYDDALVDEPPLANEINPPPGARDAIEAALDAFAEIVGSDPDLGVVVHWTDERIPYGDGSVIGLHRGCGDIWVTWWEGADFSRIALPHELGHCVRRSIHGDSDGAHSDTGWWESNELEHTIVDDVRSLMAESGY
jgi:hypothetical protein